MLIHRIGKNLRQCSFSYTAYMRINWNNYCYWTDSNTTFSHVLWSSLFTFELWCWRRLLRVPWTTRSNQSILKETSPGCSLEGLMLRLKLQYFGHLMRRIDSLEESDAGRDWGQEEKGTTKDEMAGWHHGLDGRESE